MKIVLITTGLGMGGAEVLVKELALRLRLRGHAVTVVSLRDAEYFVAELVRGGVRVVSCGFRGGIRDLGKLATLLKLLWTIRPDVVHSHLFHANIVCRLAGGLGLRSRTICSIHNTYEVGSRSGYSGEGISIRERIYKYTDSWCDITAQISLKGLRRYTDLGIVARKRIEIVYNGINLETIKPMSDLDRSLARRQFAAPSEFLWLCIGRHVEQKNFGLLIAAAARLRADGACFKLWIFGDGPLFSKHEAEIAALGLGEVVRLGGVRVNLREIIPAFDAFVLSSSFEGLPVVLIEAAAAALPVISTDTGGCAEIFDPSGGGAVVPPGDLERLVRAMSRLMKLSSPRLHEMGLANRRRVYRHFDIDAVTRQWEYLYQTCLPVV